jgi:methionyl aminopeptidase
MSGLVAKTADEINAMREGGHMLAAVLQYLATHTEAGMTPQDASALARKELQALGGKPAFLGFHGYPDIICISVNAQVQHSIPTNIPFRRGDVVNYDFGVLHKGLVTDGGVSICVEGAYTDDTRRLIEGTQQSLADGLSVVRAGCRVGDISAAIEKTLRAYKLGIVQELVGHGVGHDLHEDPEVPNYGRVGTGPVLEAGVTIAVEPITTLGNHGIALLPDNWTLVTRDGSWSAQFEHTIVVTEGGCEILTQI